jgi:uncharacterized membrane protein
VEAPTLLHWFVILVLAVFIYRQADAIRRLEARLDAALRALSPSSREPDPDVWAADPPVARPEPVTPPAPVTSQPATSLAEARPAARTSTPVTAAPQSPPVPRALRTPVDDWGVSDDEPTRRSKPPQPQRPARDLSWAALSTWLAENGLAWLGGGGLALGGLLLVVYAAQQGVFTPPLRIAAAVILGGLMIASSEWILRQKRAPGGRHLLAAAVAAGAGAVTLYGAVCAAYTLYGLIPFPVAAVLTAAISLGLLGLSLRHGEPLALLALFGAVITPWVTGMDAWAPAVLYAYALLIGVTGFMLSATRLWGKAGLVTVVGLLAWSLAHAFDGGAALLILAAAGPVCAVLWRRRRHPDDAPGQALTIFLHQPSIALGLASLVSAPLWLLSPHDVGGAPEAALVAGILVAIGAAIITLGMAPPMIFAVPVGIAIFASLATLASLAYDPVRPAGLAWLHGLTAVIAVATLIGALRSSAAARTPLLTIGGVGLALLASLSWPLLDQIGAALPWLPAAILSAAMFASAGLIARRVEQAASDKGLAFWLAAAAELAFLSIHAATPTHLEPVALAVAALLLAFAAGRLAWWGLAQAGVVGGLLTLAMLFRPDFIGAALDGSLALPIAMGVSIGAAALLFAGARLMSGPDGARRNEVEAQVTASLMVLLTGLFIGLHVLLSGARGDAASGGLFEGALRTLLLLAAGVLLVTRQRSDDGHIARWRTVVVVGVGILHGLLAQGLIWNPWWGVGAPPVGLPVVNTLIVAFLAPAALLAVSAWRRRPTDAWARLWAAAGVLFAFLWVLLVLRHLFHGDAMSWAGIGRAESAAYAVLLLLTGRILTLRTRSEWVGVIALSLNWIALVVSVVVFGLYASPWWGPLNTPLASTPHALLLFALYAAGAVLIAGLRKAPDGLGKAATAVTVGVLFVLMTLLIRWLFHGAEMEDAAPGGGLETWTFSALWAVFGLATLSFGTLRKDVTLRWAGLLVLLVTAVKVLFFDLSQLEGVVRAASFLVVGALFLAGALAARRLNTHPTPKTNGGDAEEP